jgi:hypothetical protein
MFRLEDSSVYDVASVDGTSEGDGGRQQMRARISFLEDALEKSEADRAAVYELCQRLRAEVGTARDEQAYALHERREAAASPDRAAANELLRLRNDALLLQEQLDGDGNHREAQAIRIAELEGMVKALRKAVGKKEQEDVSLAELHYSNERLSSQLSALQKQQARDGDAPKLAECEAALAALTDAVGEMEAKMAALRAAHAAEVGALRGNLDAQFGEMSVERAECDRIVSRLGDRVQGLMNENEALRAKATAAARPRPYHR